MPLGGYGGYIPPNIGGGIMPQKENVINFGEAGLLPPKGGLGTAPPVDPLHGGINPGAGIPRMPMPTPMGGLPPGIPPVTAPMPGRLPESIPPRPGPGSLLGGNTGPHGPGGGFVPPNVNPPMNSTQPPMRRNGGVGGVAPRPAQGPMMRKQRGRGGMSMF
jgi:hypothetical protein